MVNHTPGPWLVLGPSPLRGNHDEGGDFAIFVERGDKKLIVAEAYRRTSEYDCEPVEANANLIAAAPELLAALVMLREVCACSNECDPNDMTCATNVADAAIAKARGQS